MPLFDPIISLLLLLADILGLAWLSQFFLGRRGDKLCRLEGHQGTIRKIAVSVDGAYAASASGDHTVRVWDTSSGECIGTCGSIPEKLGEGGVGSGHAHVVTSVCFSPNGAMVASVSLDKSLRIWSVDGQAKAVLQGHTQVLRACAWSPKGDCLISAGSDRAVRAWRIVQNGSLSMQDMEVPAGETIEFAFADIQSTQLTDVHEDSEGFRQLTLRRRNALPGFACSLTSLFGHEGSVNDVRFSPDGGRLLSVDAEGKALLFDPAWTPAKGSGAAGTEGLRAKVMTGPGPALCCAWSSTGDLFAVGTQGGHCVVCRVAWDRGGDAVEMLRTVRLGENYVTDVTFVTGEGGREMVTCADNRREVRLWEAASGRREGTLWAHSRVLEIVALRGGVVVGCEDRSLSFLGVRRARGKAKGA